MFTPDLFFGPNSKYRIDLCQPVSYVLNRIEMKISMDVSDMEAELISEHQALVDSVFARAGAALQRAYRCWSEAGGENVNFIWDCGHGKLREMAEAAYQALQLTNLGFRIYEAFCGSMLHIGCASEELGDPRQRTAFLLRAIWSRQRHDAAKALALVVKAARQADPVAMDKAVGEAELLIDRIDNYSAFAASYSPFVKRLWSLALAFPVLSAGVVCGIGTIAIYCIYMYAYA